MRLNSQWLLALKSHKLIITRSLVTRTWAACADNGHQSLHHNVGMQQIFEKVTGQTRPPLVAFIMYLRLLD